LLQPMKFRYAHGDVEASLRFDGSRAPIRATMELNARDMQLKQLLTATESMPLNLGRAGGSAKLTASGDSIGALLGAANGQLQLALDGGTVSKALLETAGLNLPNMLVTKLFGDRQVQINCADAEFVASGGAFDARGFVIDTDVARIDVTG